MNWHRDIPPVVWVVGIVFFVGGLIVAPIAIFVILGTFAGIAAVGLFSDFVGRLYEKTQRSKDAVKRSVAIANEFKKKNDAKKRVHDNEEAS